MSKQDAIQTAINRASLMMNVEADVARALKQSETHPALATVLMRMHHAQHQLDQENQQLRKSLLEQAQLLSRLVDSTVDTQAALTNLVEATGIEPQNVFAEKATTEYSG